MKNIFIDFGKNSAPLKLRLLDISGNNEYGGHSANLRSYTGAMSFAVLGQFPDDMHLIYNTLTLLVHSGFMDLTVGISPRIDKWHIRYTLTNDEKNDDIHSVLTVSYHSFVGGNTQE